MRAIPERLKGVFTIRRYTNPRLPLPLPYLTMFLLTSKLALASPPPLNNRNRIEILSVQNCLKLSIGGRLLFRQYYYYYYPLLRQEAAKQYKGHKITVLRNEITLEAPPGKWIYK